MDEVLSLQHNQWSRTLLDRLICECSLIRVLRWRFVSPMYEFWHPWQLNLYTRLACKSQTVFDLFERKLWTLDVTETTLALLIVLQILFLNALNPSEYGILMICLYSSVFSSFNCFLTRASVHNLSNVTLMLCSICLFAYIVLQEPSKNI